MHTTLQQFPRLGLELLAVSGLAILVISMLAQDRALEAVLPTLGLFAAAAYRLLPSVNRVLSSVQSLRYGLPVFDILHTELKLATPEVGGTHRPLRLRESRLCGLEDRNRLGRLWMARGGGRCYTVHGGR